MSNHDCCGKICGHKDIKFCNHCKVPHCVTCGKEWQEKTTWYYSNYNGYRQGITGPYYSNTILTTGSTEVTSNTLVVTPCEHKDSNV